MVYTPAIVDVFSSPTDSLVGQLLRSIKTRVQYNDMVYMGTCGGAASVGKHYWSGPPLKLFDIFEGVSLQYDANMPPAACTLRIDARTFKLQVAQPWQFTSKEILRGAPASHAGKITHGGIGVRQQPLLFSQSCATLPSTVVQVRGSFLDLMGLVAAFGGLF